MKTLRSLFAAILALGMALLGAASSTLAQEPNVNPATVASDSGGNRSALDEVTVAAGDIESLIDNLSAGAAKVFRIRVFSAGQVLDYPESMIAVEREAGVFSPQARSLVAIGTMNGTPVIEDFRFVDHAGRFYVLRDIHLNGTAADVVTGRSLPTTLETISSNASVEKAEQNMFQANAIASKPAPPAIRAIHGYTDEAATGINDGLTDMSYGKTFNGYRVIDNVQPSVFVWDVIGANFGTAKGTIQLAGITVPVSQITWGPSEIKFYPAVPYYFVAGPTVLSISTSNGTVTMALNFAPAISGRIFGQCTWLVALVRMNAGRPVPSTSFGPGGNWTPIDAGYVPRQWDALTYQWPGHKHTAIIVGVSAPAKSGNTTTWTVTIEEANAASTNLITTKPSPFQVQNGQVTKSIQSDAKSGVGPGWYYR